MQQLVKELTTLGLAEEKAKKISKEIDESLQKNSREVCFKQLIEQETYAFPIFLALYKYIYPNWEEEPKPAWFPEVKASAKTNIGKVMQELGMTEYQQFHQWSFQEYQSYWQTVVKLLAIHFTHKPSAVVDLAKGILDPTWFPNAQLNIAENCFRNKSGTAIISQAEDGALIETSYQELDELSNRIANSLDKYLKKGERAAIIMPMTREAVAIYLAILKIGAVVVAIPDSFAAEEIQTRLRIAPVKMVFCVAEVLRDSKVLHLYDKVIQANPPKTIVLSKGKTIQLRAEDHYFDDFLENNISFTPVSCTPNDHINILFSSGTTGDPKAIPWTQITPLKCGADAYFHHNLGKGDVFCWPTNLGWMMGPWLIFASLLNQATIALFEGSPNGTKFGEFLVNANVTHLGVVPTMVKSWRTSGCLEGLAFPSIKLFTSTGERSSVEDMLYLMSLANYAPVIEYCGGTEIAGSYITGTLVQPAAPAAFTTPALGLDFVMINEQGELTNNGEVALLPPSIGLSQTLLNKDHTKVYYADMPMVSDKILRRHGDQVKLYQNGFFRLLGRTDDTMKLGGIKISSAEIEAVLNVLPFVYETAAIACHPQEGGPSELVIYVVMKDKNQPMQTIKMGLQQSIKEHLNPLFKIYDVVVVDILPRTASNKMMRRLLRDDYESRKDRRPR